MDEQWFTVEQVAGRLQVTAQTVRRWLRAGALIGRNFGGRTGYRIPEPELARFLQTGAAARTEKLAALARKRPAKAED